MTAAKGSTMTKDLIEEDKEQTGVPVCEKCGNIMIKEESEWVCPHCQGEINFLGEEDE